MTRFTYRSGVSPTEIKVVFPSPFPFQGKGADRRRGVEFTQSSSFRLEHLPFSGSSETEKSLKTGFIDLIYNFKDSSAAVGMTRFTYRSGVSPTEINVVLASINIFHRPFPSRGKVPIGG